MQTYGRLPVAFVRGAGHPALGHARARSTSTSSRASRSTSLGHAHPQVAAAIADQANTLLHLSNLYYNDQQPRARGEARCAARRRRARVLLQLGRRGERVRDQAGAPSRPAQRRSRALPRDQRVRVVPRPHAHDARGDRPAAEAGDVPAAAVGIPSGRVRRPRRARSRDGRAGRRGHARTGAGRRRREPGVGRVPARRAAAVRRARGVADRRRGADRARPHRQVVRLPALRHRARHRHGGESARQRRADRRVLGARRRRGRVRRRRSRHDVRRPAARGAGRARGARGDGSRRRAGARPRARAPASPRVWRSSTASPTCAARAC